MLLFFVGRAQDEGWKTETVKDGKVTVKSKVVSQQVNSKEKNVFYYTVETIADINLEKAEAFMRNSANYKKFLESMGTTSEIKKISTNAWVTYVYFDNSWPVSDNDCVQKFELVKTNTGFNVIGKAAPNESELMKVSRIYLYDVVYRFEKISDKQTKVTIDAVFAPASSIPKALMKSWLPDGPAKIITRLTKELS